MDAAIASFRVQRPFLADLTTFSKDFSRRDARAARRAAAAQPGARDRHAACSSGVPRAQRRARARRSTRSATSPRRRRPTPRSAALTAHGHHAQPAAALLRPVRDGLQRAELLLHLPRRALLRARHAPARRSARCSTSPAPQDDSARLDGRRRAGQRQERQAGHAAVRCRTSRTARRSRPTAAPTARPASAATSSATRASTRSKYKIDPRPADARRRRARRSRAARGCRRARRSRPSPRPARTRPCPRRSGER